jgi:hypothetical protein
VSGVLVESETITLWALDFDPDLVCEADPNGEQCENTPIVIVRCRRCRDSFLVCGPCLEAGQDPNDWDACCDRCDFRNNSFDVVFEVIPIGAQP